MTKATARESSGTEFGPQTIAALHAVAVAAGGVSGEAELADLVVDLARSVTGGDAAALRWFEASTGSFRLLASVGARRALEPDIAADAPTAIHEAFHTGRSVVINDYATSGKATAWGRRHKIRAQVAVPLLVDGRPVGTLGVVSFSDHRFAESDAQVLSLMAALVAPALEAARLTEQVRRQEGMIAQIYEALPVAVVVFDGSGKAVYHNRVAEALVGADNVAGVRARTLDLYGENGALLTAEERPTTRAYKTRAPIRNTVVGMGEMPRRWFLLDVVPLPSEAAEVDRLVTSSIEITSLKSAEERQRLDAERLRRLIEIQTELGDIGLGASNVMDVVARRAIELTGAPGAAVQILEGDEVVVASAAGFGSDLLGVRFPTCGNPITGCIEEGCSQSTHDAWVDPRCDQRAAHVTGIRSLIMAPIRWEGQVLGGLQLQSPDPNAFGEADQTTLELLAGFAGAAISRARGAEAIRASEQLFSGAFQASGIGMALTSLDGRVTRANPALCQMLAYTEAELAGMDARTLVVPKDLDRVVETLAELYLRSDPAVLATDLRVRHRDGRTIWARLTASLIRVDGEPRHVLLHLVDVSEERRAEAILRSEQDRLAEIIAAQQDINDTGVEIDRILGTLVVRAVHLTGASAAAVMLPNGGEMRIHAAAGAMKIPIGFSLPMSRSLAGLAYQTSRLQRVSNARVDARAHEDTATRAGIGAMIATPMLHEGRAIGVLLLLSVEPGSLDEVDARTLEVIAAFGAAAFERATTTRRLAASEQRTRAVIESAPDPIVIFDGSGQIVDFNPGAERAFQRRREEMIGESAATLIAERFSEGFARWIRDGKKAYSAEYAGGHFEVTGRRADGTEFQMEVDIADLPEEIQLGVAFIRDLTMRERLKESRERLEAVVSSARVILLGCDINGLITLAQGSGLSILDAGPEQMLGRPLPDVLEGQPEAVEFLGRALNGEAVSGLIHLSNPDRYLESVLSPIRDADGAVSGVSAVLTDVTARLLQAEHEASLLAALSDIGESLVMTQDGLFVSSNDAYLKLTGYTTEELRALPSLFDLVPAAERDQLAKMLRARLASSEAVIHLESALVTKDGHRREIEASMTRVTEEGVSRLLTIVRDVTDQNRAEEALRDSEAKSRLMAMMNHEVRTPLNSILGFTHLLTEERSGVLNEKQRRYVNNIQVSGDHLLALVNDSLDLAKLDAGRVAVKLENVRVQAVMEQAADQMRPLAEARGLSLSVQDAGPADAHADSRQLGQVLLNLLSNAIRHTHAGGTVRLAASTEPGLVAISVVDSGEGIAPEDQPRLFEEFYQAANHAPGGIGLGLAISRRLVEMMGGSISVQSELGSGSTFTVRVPIPVES